MTIPRILITSGEPAGIGPDIIIQLAQQSWPAELVVLSDPALLMARARDLKLPLALKPFDEHALPQKSAPSQLKILPLALTAPVVAGRLNKANATYVMQLLASASQLALKKKVAALVTAPVHKGILNEAGFSFRGHTEFFAEQAGVAKVLMLFVMEKARVALATTHLPLAQVPAALNAEGLETSLRLLHHALVTQFHLADPTILVCGLNPHAGEGGHLGREEIEVITPTLEKLRREQLKLVGPLAADTIFTAKLLQQADAIVAMYHDQALPVVKYMSFGKAVNLTLGLPFIRTSVDHGTALDVAATGQADAGSIEAALALALTLS
jgi:4-hydroxythreonine-4-phosphate dehydrogenase